MRSGGKWRTPYCGVSKRGPSLAASVRDPGSTRQAVIDSKGREPVAALAAEGIFSTHSHVRDIVDAGPATKFTGTFAITPHFIFVNGDGI